MAKESQKQSNFGRGELAPQPQYRVYAINNALGQSTTYFNLGFWRDHPKDADHASEELALLLGETASLAPKDRVLDVGFGFGDQDILWCRRFAPEKIFGVNFCPHQVWIAQQKVKELGLSQKIIFLQGSATHLPFPEGSFDTVMALECAFHFKKREDFFREAFRVLKPGGRLAVTDVINFRNNLPLKERLAQFAVRQVWEYPEENLYPRSIYLEKLTSAGFRAIELNSIFDDVIPPVLEYARKRLGERELVARMDRVFNMKLRAGLWLQKVFEVNSPFDYIIVRAVK